MTRGMASKAPGGPHDRTLPGQADVLVIGGGVVGLCATYFLQQAGRHVTVVDKAEIGRGSTAGNAGHIVPSHVTPLAAPGVISQALRWMLTSPSTSPFSVQPRLSAELVAWLWRFRGACTPSAMNRGIPVLRALMEPTPTMFTEILEAEQIECFHEQTGLLMVYKTKGGFADAVKEAELLRERGVPVAVLDRTALHTVEPALRPDVIGAIHLQGDGHLDPALFLGGLAESIRRRGATLCDMTEVLGCATSNERIQEVKTTRGDMRVSDVVLAAGAWSGQCARAMGVKLCLQAGKGYSVTFRRPDGAPRMPMILGEPKVAVTSFGSLLRGTGRLEITTPNLKIRERWLQRIEAAMRDYLNLEGDLHVVERWAGLRPTTPDGLPMIGRLASIQNLTVATGHAMLGLTLGPVTGKVVAQLVSGMTSDVDVRALSPARFRQHAWL